MATNTNTRTETLTITSGDVRLTIQNLSTEMRACLQAAAHVVPDFDVEQAEIDCGLLALQDVVSGFRLQFYAPATGDLIREYSYANS